MEAMDEKRLTMKLLRRWEESRVGRPIPCFENFDIASIEDASPQSMIVRIEDRERHHLICERMGEQIVTVCGRDLTGHRIYPAEAFPDAVLLNHLEEVCNQLSPVGGAGQAVDVKGIKVKWRACFLPFGDAKNALTHIVVG